MLNHSKTHPSLMPREAVTETLLTTSWQRLYFFARSENIKHNKSTLQHKCVQHLLASDLMYTGVSIKSANIANNRETSAWQKEKAGKDSMEQRQSLGGKWNISNYSRVRIIQ